VTNRESLILGIPAPLCADRWCTDSCPKEAKHTETQYLTWFGKTTYIHGRESILFRDRKKDYNTIHGGGGSLHSNSTPSSHTLLHLTAGLLPLTAPHFLSLVSHILHSLLKLCSQIMPLFVGISWQLLLLFCQQ